jgi:hypothetical protein
MWSGERLGRKELGWVIRGNIWQKGKGDGMEEEGRYGAKFAVGIVRNLGRIVRRLDARSELQTV